MAVHTMTLDKRCSSCPRDRAAERLILWMSGRFAIAVCPKCDTRPAPKEAHNVR